MAKPIKRDDVMTMFRPIVPLLDSIIAAAQKASAPEIVAAANPEVTRDSHVLRLAGTKRWILVADGLVATKGQYPSGFGVASTNEDHNSGKYVFSFSRGVFTIRQRPHQDDEGAYLQERLDELFEQMQLADGIDAQADLKVCVSVPAKGSGRLIATHPTFDRPMVIPLIEIGQTPIVVAPNPGPKQTTVRSTRLSATESEKPAKDPS